jgi:hypothetical protein
MFRELYPYQGWFNEIRLVRLFRAPAAGERRCLPDDPCETFAESFAFAERVSQAVA